MTHSSMLRFNVCAAVLAMIAATCVDVAVAQTTDQQVATPTHADRKVAKEQSKADKKADVAQAKADKKKTDAQSDADKEAAKARVKDAKEE